MSNSSLWLYTDRLVDVLDIESYDFTIYDFTHALCLINRYTGNTVKPYSVGEHTLIGSSLPEIVDEGLARAFFLHDFSEVIVNDLPRPVKRQLPEYMVLEERVQKHIFNVFGEPWENMQAIAGYDTRMCQDEMQQIFKTPKDLGLQPLGFTVKFLPWDECELLLNDRGAQLGLV